MLLIRVSICSSVARISTSTFSELAPPLKNTSGVFLSSVCRRVAESWGMRVNERSKVPERK